MNDNHHPKRQTLILSSVACQAPEVGVWLAALNDCRARTHEVIDGIGDDELDWVCPLSGNSVATLLYHVAAIELDWLHSEILEQECPSGFRAWFPYDVRDADGNLTTVAGDSAERHEERLHYARSRLVAALSTMSFLEFRRVRHLEAYDVSPEWVVHHLLQHEAGHRGQIAVLRHRFKCEQSQRH